MAGEWIKINSNLHTKPEVFKMARLLAENVDTTVGLLLRFWVWADCVTVDGRVDAVESQDVDAVVKRVGFYAALRDVGWVRDLPNGAGIEIVNFERNNGESAKKRALKSERQARWRAGKVDARVDAKTSTSPTTREEKRREETDTAPLALVVSKSRGSRMTSEWRLSTDQIAWTLGLCPSWKPEDVLRIAEGFRDYWLGVAGAKGVKADWDATWRNWVRRDLERNPARVTAPDKFAGAL